MSGLPATPASSVPVLALGDVLLVTLQGELHDGTAEQLQDHITHRIAHHPVPVGGVVIDISGVEIVDSFLGRILAEIAANARLLAITLVELGLTLPGLVTALDVDGALSLLGRAPSAAAPAHPEGDA